MRITETNSTGNATADEVSHEMVWREAMLVRASRGTVRDASLAGTASKVPLSPYDYGLFLEMMRNDPVISTAVDTTVDVATRNGYYFTSRTGKMTDLRMRKVQSLFDDELDFDKVIDNIFYQLVLHHVAYMECVGFKESGKATELHALETSEMLINYDDHGEILGYVQRPFGNSAKDIPFSPEEVILFTFKQIGTQVYPYNNLEPIAKTYINGIQAHDYLFKIFMNMPPKLIYVLKGASQEQRETFIANLRIAKTKYNVDLVIDSKEGAEVLPAMRPEILTGLLDILRYVRQQILMVMRVPPVWVGIVDSDGANRGNAEAQIYSFETRVRKLQQRIESQINKELMPKLGFGDLYFRWNPVSLQDESKVITNAATLKALGVDGKSVLYYLREKGVMLPAEAEVIDLMQANQAATNQTAPSRQGMDSKNDKMTSNVEKTGTSAAGGAKLEAKKENTR